MTRPLIGITVSRRSGWRIFPLMALNVWLAGGRAVRWTTAADVDVDAVDGIIIGGGDDIAPELYGAELLMASRLDRVRDTMEKWIVEEAVSQHVPTHANCHEAQKNDVA